MEQVYIETTQNVRLDFQLASLGDRFVAWLLDGLVMGVYGALVLLLVFGTSGFDATSTQVLMLIGVSLPILLYHAGMEIFFHGQSVGKMIRKIRVVNLDGTQPTVGRLLFRWIARILEFSLFPGLAMFAYMLSFKGQRLGDLAAGTTVIRLKKNISLDEITHTASVPEGYVPTFPEVRNLSYREMELIRDAFAFAQKREDYVMMEDLYKKLKIVLGVEQTELKFIPFLETVIADFQYYQHR